MSAVKDVLFTYLPAKRKQTPSGWISFDAPCCHHNGHSRDTKSRGGLISNPDGGISYNCFNCGFKASWQLGRSLSFKMKKLLRWIGVPDDTINKLALQILRDNEGVEAHTHLVSLPEFTSVQLPKDAVKISDMTDFDKHSVQVLEYINSRNFELDDTDFYYSPNLGYRDRLIVPFYYEGKTVGWTARTVLSDKKPKYLSETQPGFVYGLDDQTYDKQFVIVCEGQLDAIHIKGCALGGSEINEQQALLLERLNKPIIVIADRDLSGKKLAQQAMERGWSVSFPLWSSECNDIGDSVARYGRLYTLYSIVKGAESSQLKIKLGIKKWFRTATRD